MGDDSKRLEAIELIVRDMASLVLSVKKQTEDMAVVVGIDFGSANCSAALFSSNMGIRTLSWSNDRGFTPAVATVALDARGTTLDMFDLLKIVGRKIDDVPPPLVSRWPFRVVPGTAGKAMIEIAEGEQRRRVFTPEELVAKILCNVRERAEQQYHRSVLDTVLTVPATFNRTQRQTLRDACLIAGMAPRSLLVGSTAAGMAYLVDRDGENSEELVLVVDFGAGSLDVSLISPHKQVCIVKAIAGDSELGGDVLTERIVTHFMDDYNRQHGSDVMAKDSLRRLRRACELAKKMLSTSDRAAIYVRSLFLGGGNFSGSISRSQFEAACEDCWKRFKQLIFRVLDEGHVSQEAVDRVLLCGGSAQIPRVRLLLEELFVGKSVEIEAKEDLQARGAAIYAASMLKIQPFNSLTLERVTPLALGLQRIGAPDTIVLLRSNTRLPVSKSQVLFSTPQKDVTYQILEGNVLQQNVSARNASKEGAHCLGMVRFDLSSGVMPLVVKIEVVFDIDASDSLIVTAMETSSGKVQTITCLGDNTLLPRDSIAQLHDELVQRRGLQNPISLNSVSNPSLTNLVEYSAALQRMMSENRLEITIDEDEKRVLAAKLEGISRWLQSASGSPSAANMEIMEHHLQTLRRLHFSIAASCALAHLRETDL